MTRPRPAPTEGGSEGVTRPAGTNLDPVWTGADSDPFWTGADSDLFWELRKGPAR